MMPDRQIASLQLTTLCDTMYLGSMGHCYRLKQCAGKQMFPAFYVNEPKQHLTTNGKPTPLGLQYANIIG